MNLLRRTITSLREKGIGKTIALAWRRVSILSSKFGDLSFDRRYGTDTLELVELDNLDIASANKASGMRYEPTRARPLRRLFKAMAFPKSGGFVDLGCGKGRVLLVASAYGFERVVGVEFSHELCEQARMNLALYREKTGVQTHVEIIESDVVDYPIRDDDTTFFFFNPFGATMMTSVLSNIIASHMNHSRKIWLIYHNPEFGRVIDQEAFFVRVGSYNFGGCEFVVYTNRN